MRVRQFLRFARTADADLLHAQRTATWLRDRGADDDLVQAGFLHDIAKPVETRIWHRVAGALLPGRLRATMALGHGTFARYLDHARLSAEEARRRGASERVVRLIERHHEPPVTGDERMLRAADAESLP